MQQTEQYFKEIFAVIDQILKFGAISAAMYFLADLQLQHNNYLANPDIQQWLGSLRCMSQHNAVIGLHGLEFRCVGMWVWQ